MPRKEDLILQTLTTLVSKVDNLDSRVDSVDKTLVKQEANLGEHMRRTELAEKAIEVVQQEAKASVLRLQSQFEPVQKHVAYMEGALKGLGVLATIVAVIAGIIKIFGL